MDPMDTLQHIENAIDLNLENKILRKLFRKGEFSYAFSDISKAIGPMVDLIFVSAFFGPMGVSVVGYVGPLIMFYELIGTGISSGARNRVSSLIGAGRLEEANQVYSSSVILGTLTSVLMTVLTLVFCTGVAQILGAREAEVLLMTKQYLYGYVIGVPFFSMTRILKLYLEMEGQYARANLTSFMTTVIDVAADALVVFVFHGGMFWIGIATSLGYILPFFITLSYFLQRKNGSLFRFSVKYFSKKESREIIRLGTPPAIVKGSNSLGGVLINNILTAMNVNYLVAVYGVFSQITVFVRSAWYAPSDTMLAFAGVFIGEENRRALKDTLKMSIWHAILLSTGATILLLVLADPLSAVFMKTQDPAALVMCAECVRIGCVSLIFHAIVFNFSNYLLAVKKIKFSSIYCFLLECGDIVPITLLMVRIFNYRGAFIAKIVHMAIMSLIAFIYIWRFKEAKKFSDKMILMPRDFGFTPENEIAIVAESAEDVMNLSRFSIAFALEHGADGKRAKTLGLIMEEMSGLYLENGFSDGKKHHINARLVAKDDDLIVRLRDDFQSYNITKVYKEEVEKNGSTKDMGLAIVMRMAKEVKYAAAFGANNLIIRM